MSILCPTVVETSRGAAPFIVTMATSAEQNGVEGKVKDSAGAVGTAAGGDVVGSVVCVDVPTCVNGTTTETMTGTVDQNQNCATAGALADLKNDLRTDLKYDPMEDITDVTPDLTSQSSEGEDKMDGSWENGGSTHTINGDGDGVSKTSSEPEEDSRKPTEEELLRQLEEANRMLEADEKSYPTLAAFSATPGHSRKGSGSSIVSSTSSNSFYSAQNSNECEDPNVDPNQTPVPAAAPPTSTPEPTVKQKKAFLRALGKNRKRILTLKRNSVPDLILNGCESPASSSMPSSPVTKNSPSLMSPAGFEGQGHEGSEQTADPVRTILGMCLAPTLPPLWLLPTNCTTACSSCHRPISGTSSETLWEIWGRIINDWEPVRKKPAFLRELVRKGIPHEFRGMAWQLILGVHDSVWKQEYAEHMKKTSPCEKLIRRDIARTFPDHDFFKEKDGFGQESLFNVMKAYSLHDREVGYCQGSGFIVGLLLMQMPEEDAFAVLVRLMQDFRLRELFKPSMAELGLCMFKLECLIQELLPTLLVHFQTQNFDTSMYASSWFLTLYVTSLPLSLARRIMDLFVSEGMEMIFRVGVAILQSCQEDLLALDMEGLLKYLQKDLKSRFELDQDQDNLLHTAYSIKYSHKKMKKLEKEYTALKTKENEDQIELRRLRTENRLLRQRIENLEKVEAKLLRQNEESATLADKLVQDQVTWAQEVEELYATRSQLSVTRVQLEETQKKLLSAEDIIGDIRKRTCIIEDAVHLDESEERNMVKHLQEELIAVRLREAETAGIIRDMRQKISELEDTNLRLQRAPSNDVQQLQEELIAVKLREAEANLSLKELRMKVNEIESYWEAHMERVRQSSPKEKNSKTDLRHLQEEVMGLKLKEARAVSDVKDAKQKLMELETQNQICTNQIRRMGEDNKELKKQMEEALEREKDLRTNIKDLTRKLDDTESKRKEEGMMARIKEAESVQQLAELRHKIALIDIQKEELLAAGRLHEKGENQELKNKLLDLQDELKLSVSPTPKPVSSRSLMTDSYLGDNSDEELDAEIKDSENLDRTLSEIIEGKSPSLPATPSRATDPDNSGQDLSLTATDGDGSNDRGAVCSADTAGGEGSSLSHSEPSCVDDLSGGQAVCSASGGVEEASTTATMSSTVMSGDDEAFATEPTTGATADADSGETNVIAACDDNSLPKESTGAGSSSDSAQSKGKSHLLMGEGHSLHNSPKMQSRTIGLDERLNPNIRSPNQKFPEDWELYDEVVVVDRAKGTQVMCRNSSERDTTPQRAGSHEISERGWSPVSVVKGSGTLGQQDTLLHGRGTSSQHRTPPQDNSTSGLKNTPNVKNSRPKSVANSVSQRVKGAGKDGADVADPSVEEIPDIVVIYEPSCKVPSLLCRGDGADDDDDDFVLKESTV
ncbi:uncharacterized protein LOC101846777 isoform X2 [Aplysia californica]|uniref:Uncharacterized protein LOC101846777 isoform X2 n=1 Tax=Aplysia californica TaxID=6500 RepID=A0ABM1AC93_APLCA|nr:uncharacterized protein LOC101846777 isoform X2 [Aplysia californica]